MAPARCAVEKAIMRIVIVDNFPHVRDSLKSLLSTLKEVEIIGEAQDVPGAINLAKELQPDIAILDINIPGGSGFDVLKELKKKAGLVIVLTSYSSPPFRQKAQKAGADFFFDKSTEFEKMIEVLKQKAAQMTMNAEGCQ
ncbi:response regulator transcription factor [candidate division KSB1 bacterium]|nr:response regulator transcription factor [candidate division KSB1 bacterium]